MPHLFHTSDWQLGLRPHGIFGPPGLTLTDMRFAVVDSLVAKAADSGAAALVVAGDVFEDNAVGAETLSRCAQILNRYPALPIILVAGNQDCLEPHGALERLRPLVGTHVTIPDSREPIVLGDLIVYPCPLRRRGAPEDPTFGLKPTSREGFHVVVAHGGSPNQPCRTQSRIDTEHLINAGFDYVALGDCHLPIRLHPKVAYAGTPEPTGLEQGQEFGIWKLEMASGDSVFHPTQSSRWTRLSLQLSQTSAWEEIAKQLPQDVGQHDVLYLELTGEISAHGETALSEWLEKTTLQALSLHVQRQDLKLVYTEDDLACLQLPPGLSNALHGLVAAGDHEAAQVLYALLRDGGVP